MALGGAARGALAAMGAGLAAWEPMSGADAGCAPGLAGGGLDATGGGFGAAAEAGRCGADDGVAGGPDTATCPDTAVPLRDRATDGADSNGRGPIPSGVSEAASAGRDAAARGLAGLHCRPRAGVGACGAAVSAGRAAGVAGLALGAGRALGMSRRAKRGLGRGPGSIGAKASPSACSASTCSTITSANHTPIWPQPDRAPGLGGRARLGGWVRGMCELCREV